MSDRKLKRLAMGGLLSAIIAALTAFVRIPIPGGYLHPGDAAVALAGAALGPFAALPSALGGFLADLLGYPQYAVFTLVVKGLMGLVCGLACRDGRLNVRAVLGLLAAAAICVAGYFAADLLLGGIGMALADLLWNSLQAALFLASGVLCLSVLPRIRQNRKT